MVKQIHSQVCFFVYFLLDINPFLVGCIVRNVVPPPLGISIYFKSFLLYLNSNRQFSTNQATFVTTQFFKVRQNQPVQ